MKIYLASGHGGSDTGAISGVNNERDEVNTIVNQTITNLKLKPQNGFVIVQVPNELRLEENVKWINSDNDGRDGNICIEVHLNSNEGTPGTGTETYYGEPNLANVVHNKIVGVLKLKNRGVKEGNFLYFNNATKPESCLVELGFINNITDLQIIRERGATALTSAIERIMAIYNVKVEAPPPSKDVLLTEVKNKLLKEIEDLKAIHDMLN